MIEELGEHLPVPVSFSQDQEYSYAFMATGVNAWKRRRVAEQAANTWMAKANFP